MMCLPCGPIDRWARLHKKWQWNSQYRLWLCTSCCSNCFRHRWKLFRPIKKANNVRHWMNFVSIRAMWWYIHRKSQHWYRWIVGKTSSPMKLIVVSNCCVAAVASVRCWMHGVRHLCAIWWCPSILVPRRPLCHAAIAMLSAPGRHGRVTHTILAFPV